MKMKDSMDRMEFDQGNLQEEAPRRVQRRKRPELKPIWFAAVAVVLLAVVLIAALTDTTAFDGLRRSVTYARAKKDETGCAQLYHYAADRTSCFASLDGSLAIVTNSQLLVMQEDGQVVCNETVKWTSCTVAGTGSLAAAYDIGGSDVYVLNAQGLVRKITCGGEILSVTLTREGRLAVRRGRCKGICLSFCRQLSDDLLRVPERQGDGRRHHGPVPGLLHQQHRPV